MNAHKERPRTISSAAITTKQRPYWLLLLFIGIGSILLYQQHNYKGVEHLVVDEEGNVDLSPERKAKMQKKFDELDNSEQYVLRAAANKYYPCYSCPNQDSILLMVGEVWKYGATSKGESGRYSKRYLRKEKLRYEVQFRGNYAECLKEEQRKIYQYGYLPENLWRSKPLIRPPGNSKDE